MKFMTCETHLQLPANVTKTLTLVHFSLWTQQRKDNVEHYARYSTATSTELGSVHARHVIIDNLCELISIPARPSLPFPHPPVGNWDSLASQTILKTLMNYDGGYKMF